MSGKSVMGNKGSPLKTRAEAVEKVNSGIPIAEVAREFGVGTATISRWYGRYLGYRGPYKDIEVRQSKV